MIAAATLAQLGFAILPLAFGIGALACSAVRDDKRQARRLAALAMFIATIAFTVPVFA